MKIIFQVISGDAGRSRGGAERLGLEGAFNEGTRATARCNSSQLISLISTLRITRLCLGINFNSKFDWVFELFYVFIN